MEPPRGDFVDDIAPRANALARLLLARGARPGAIIITRLPDQSDNASLAYAAIDTIGAVAVTASQVLPPTPDAAALGITTIASDPRPPSAQWIVLDAPEIQAQIDTVFSDEPLTAHDLDV